MTVENIISFVYLSRFKSFQKAADALYITQPTFSSRIKSLENDLGCLLVNRDRRTVELTEKGELFLPYAIRIFDIYLEAQSALKQTSETVIIGSIRTVALTILPGILNWMQQKRPEAFINVITRNTSGLLQCILKQECHIAVTEMITHPEVISVPLFRDPIGLFASSSHPLSRRTSPLSLKEISLMKNICCNTDSTFWPHVVGFFEKHQLRLSPAYDIDNLEGLKTAITSGTAVGFLPHLATAVETAHGELHQLPVDPALDLYRDICVLYRKEAKPSYIDPFINYIQMTYQQQV